jgi:hypothetical protein
VPLASQASSAPARFFAMRSPYGELLSAAAALTLVACANLATVDVAPYEGPARKETVWAVNEGHQLLRFTAAQPARVDVRLPLTGLQPGEKVLGIDFRVARGVLYALGSGGHLYTVNTSTGALTQVGQGSFALPLSGAAFGFDFNPAADRLRVVGDGGQNLRLHPDTGAVVDGNAAAEGLQPDGKLGYAPGDVNAGAAPRLEAAAYTYNKQDEKLTTNYAIDAQRGLLVRQGSIEGRTPAVSPNLGQLFTVGSLGVGAPISQVSFDIADLDNAALAAASLPGRRASELLLIDLDTGRARGLGRVGAGEVLRGLAIEP